MRVLLAINATDPKNLADRALRWTPRMGFELRVFVPKTKRKKYLAVVDDANYHWYLAMSAKDTVVTRSIAEEYALKNNFDLLVTIPEDLLAWRKGMQFKNSEIKQAYEAIASARGEFNRKPRKRIKHFANGAVMRRLI